MTPLSAADPQAFRIVVIGELLLARQRPPTAEASLRGVRLLHELAAAGSAVPPPGFVIDVMHLLEGTEAPEAGTGARPWSDQLAQQYDDAVLGKLYADRGFERAADAVRAYPAELRLRAVAFVIRRMTERLELPANALAAAALRGLVTRGASALVLGIDLTHAEPYAESRDAIRQLIARFRRAADLLDAADLLALEQRTAVADLAEYVAHRQVLEAVSLFGSHLPTQKLKPRPGRREVASRVFDEDQYPVGGYSSISNRGTVESLLHSQLAFMEPAESPDLFDVKYVRDELFYYARDENQFLRRRRSFAFVLDGACEVARFKDAELPAQRVVVTLGLLGILVRRLEHWLATDALRFDFYVVPDESGRSLAAERRLLGVLHRDGVARGQVVLHDPTPRAAVEAALTAAGRTSQVQALTLSPDEFPFEADGVGLARLGIGTAEPELRDDRGAPLPLDGDDALGRWFAAARLLLELWV